MNNLDSIIVENPTDLGYWKEYQNNHYAKCWMRRNLDEETGGKFKEELRKRKINSRTSTPEPRENSHSIEKSPGGARSRSKSPTICRDQGEEKTETKTLQINEQETISKQPDEDENERKKQQKELNVLTNGRQEEAQVFTQTSNPRSHGGEKQFRYAKHWDRIGETWPLNLEKEQPTVKTIGQLIGPKYRLICSMNAKLVVMTLDTGAFGNVIHKKMARRLGLHMVPAETVTARSGGGLVETNKVTTVMVDFGSCRVKLIFYVVEAETYRENLIILGAPGMEVLKLNMDIGNKIMLIHGKFPVRIYTDMDEALEEKMSRIQEEYVSFTQTEVRTQEIIVIPQYSAKIVNVEMSQMDARKLDDTYE